MTSRVLAFIDGSNYLRAVGEAVGTEFNSIEPSSDQRHLAFDVLESLWRTLSLTSNTGATDLPVARKYWFGSYQGSEEVEYERKLELRTRDYEPVLFRKLARGKEKRVDIAVAREMLVNSFRGNCQFAYLIAGDEDYVDLVEDVKRLGVRVTVCFFKGSTSRHLLVACDYFHEIQIREGSYKELIAKIHYCPVKRSSPRRIASTGAA